MLLKIHMHCVRDAAFGWRHCFSDCLLLSNFKTWRTVAPSLLGVAHLFSFLWWPTEGRIKDFAFFCCPAVEIAHTACQLSDQQTPDQIVNIWCRHLTPGIIQDECILPPSDSCWFFIECFKFAQTFNFPHCISYFTSGTSCRARWLLKVEFWFLKWACIYVND